ncbi:hypothetical protein D9615_001247 [Tricholomella constricta]|uniref:Uncharacterized protein n=1 Tax=Tricholomella constricta TaxID=117010 RepID=A0A8H5HL66_9AGAR|nr:hypothetical protein D9615_001247 [Tricholomella constricta]
MLSVAFVAAAFAGHTYASPFTSVASTLDLVPRALSSGCSTTGTQSCKNTTAVSNLCCFEAPGGLLLQTQFWDTDPSTGPSDSWTIHGLWPDRCDLTFDSSCDPARAYTGMSSILTANGASDTLAYMQKYWVDINGQNEQFWERILMVQQSTLEVDCLPSGSARGAESLPTYTWLASAGITPSSTATYTLAALTSALKTASGGFTPALDCQSGSLNAISWYFNLKGSAIDGVFVPLSK